VLVAFPRFLTLLEPLEGAASILMAP